ncbi:unnamed protein product [Allacma fusca]|uniref:Uncharacterized protein n=1 Tax=Allacma fusca TaxID=39272 RepID=A0A8J2L1A5_9HEXA|nr:unnamed protein product [Allacma fusca]
MDVARERKKTVASANREVVGRWYLPTNDYSRNIRIIAWVRRWLSRKHREDSLDPEKLEMSEKSIWRIVQREADVERKVDLPLVKNEDGLICVKLRIILREDTESFIMPVYLPNDHPITEQLIISVHRNNCHAVTADLCCEDPRICMDSELEKGDSQMSFKMHNLQEKRWEIVRL